MKSGRATKGMQPGRASARKGLQPPGRATKGMHFSEVFTYDGKAAAQSNLSPDAQAGGAGGISSSHDDPGRSAGASAATTSANKEREDQLVEMGFDRDRAESAIDRAKGDLELAMDYLVDPPSPSNNSHPCPKCGQPLKVKPTQEKFGCPKCKGIFVVPPIPLLVLI
jgi:hypothetical protein